MSFWYWFVQFFAWVVFKTLFRNKVYRAVAVYPEGAIIAPNHSSFFDPPIIAGTWDGEVHFLASEYLFKAPVFGRMIRSLNSHPVNRGQSDLNSIKTVCKLLLEGKRVVVFPEGTRSFDGKIAPVKQGVALIAAKTKAAIIPTYIYGTYNAWNRHRKLPNVWGKTAVVYGKPILWEQFAALDRKEAQKVITEKLQDKLHELEKWYLDGAKGEVP